jgi:hypothetical protein
MKDTPVVLVHGIIVLVVPVYFILVNIEVVMQLNTWLALSGQISPN